MPQEPFFFVQPPRIASEAGIGAYHPVAGNDDGDRIFTIGGANGPDFFNVEEFPVITFKSTSVEQAQTAPPELMLTGELEMGANTPVYEVKGTLTFHGVSQELSVYLLRSGAGEDPWGGYRVGFEGSFSILRSDFEVGPTFKSTMLSDTIWVWIAVEGVKQP